MNDTQNPNNAQSGKWLITFDGMQGIVFKASNVVVPAVISGSTELGGSSNVSLEVAGDHVVYDELSFDFLIDEDFLNYSTLFEWIESNTSTNSPVLRDCSIHMLDIHGQFRGIRIDFTNARPITASGFVLDSENTVTNMQSTVECKFERMKFVRDTVEIS